MASCEIQSIEIENFRGFRRSTRVNLSGASLLLFGENGTGKSSLVEAVERVLGGRVPSLDGRGQGISTQRHARHVLGDSPRIDMTLSTGEVISLGADPSCRSPDAAQFVRDAREPLHYVLHRRHVLTVIEATPRDRYGLISPFLPLDEVTAVESAFMEASRRAKQQASEAAAELAGTWQQIRQLRGLQISTPDPSPGAALLAANQALQGIGAPHIGDLSGFAGAIRNIDRRISAVERDAARLAPQGSPPDLAALRRIAQLSASMDADAVLRAQESERQLSDGVVQSVCQELMGPLSDVEAWIARSRPQTCPVCEQPIEPSEVSARIASRLTLVRNVLSARERTKAQVRALQGATQSLQNGITAALSRPAGVSDGWWREREGLLKDALAATDEVLAVFGEGREHGRLGELIAAAKAAAASASDVGPPSAPLPTVQERGELTVRRDRLFELRSALTGLEQMLPELQRRLSDANGLSARAALADHLVERLQTARKAVVQEVFSEVAHDIDEMYGRIHPDEPLGDIALQVKARGSGSANLRGRFHDRANEDPRGYYSEAHLDSLGICVFLALRKRLKEENPEFRLLVLDDVMTSIDVSHASRLAELLLSDYDDYQMIITTHNRVWFEHMRGVIARMGKAERFLTRTIHHWSLEGGPEIRDPVEQAEELRRAMAEGSANAIAMGAGRLLEGVLAEMRYELMLAVPAKRGETYTLGDIWPAFRKKARKEYSGIERDCGDVIRDIDRLMAVRNWQGAHYNEWANSLSPSDAEGFGKSVLSLFAGLYCDSCRRYVGPSKAPSGDVSCRCGKLRYYKLPPGT